MKKRDSFSDLLCDFLTPSERVMFGRRIRIAQWLLAGKSCRAVMHKFGAGQDTVYVVDKWLRQKCGQYDEVFPSLYKEMLEKVSGERGLPTSWKSVRRKYPMHFLLFNLFLDDMEARKNLAQE
jgi:uncharacterized protein YerC